MEEGICKCLFVYNCSTDLHLSRFHSKAVQVTLSEIEKEMKSGINDSVRAAPDDSSGFGTRKELQNHRRRRLSAGSCAARR